MGKVDPEVIVDLGANAGQAALWLRCRFPRARIISAEPDPRTFATLARNHRRDPNITLCQVAVTGDDGFCGLAREDDSSWGTRVSADGRGDVDHVQAVRLETLLEQHAIESVDLLKVDIEGMEHEALGNCEALHRVGRVIGEIHADLIGVPVDEALEDMRRSGGFDAVRLHGDIFVLERR
jgi:FkbM family methyltransferase